MLATAGSDIGPLSHKYIIAFVTAGNRKCRSTAYRAHGAKGLAAAAKVGAWRLANRAISMDERHLGSLRQTRWRRGPLGYMVASAEMGSMSECG